MEGVSSNILTSLTNGSGIDIQKLARDLADVEKVPREQRLLSSQSEEEAKISAFAVIKFNIEQLIAKFENLNDASELATPNVSVSNSPALSVISANGLATPGQHEIAVASLATSQRNFSNQYASNTTPLNGGSSFNITHTSASGSATVINIAAGNDTPEGIVAAINEASVGVNAILIKESSDGSQYRILLQGNSGSDGAFSITSELTDNDLGFHDSSNGNSVSSGGIVAAQSASNASFSVNGLSISRSDNLISDVIPGVTFNLTSTHTGSNSDNITITSDNGTLKENLKSLVTSYNDVEFALKELSSSESENDELSGALRRDLAAVRTIRDTIYKAITSTSSTPSNNIKALRDIGVNLTKDGQLEFDEAKFDGVASTSFSDISKMLSAGTSNQSRYDEAAQGLAVDSIMKLEALTDQFTGLIVTRTNTSSTRLAEIETDLQELVARTELIYERYLTQFTVMETLVNQLNSTRESMTTTWNNLGLYKDK